MYRLEKEQKSEQGIPYTKKRKVKRMKEGGNVKIVIEKTDSHGKTKRYQRRKHHPKVTRRGDNNNSSGQEPSENGRQEDNHGQHHTGRGALHMHCNQAPNLAPILEASESQTSLRASIGGGSITSTSTLPRT